jgi:hypothetical protein
MLGCALFYRFFFFSVRCFLTMVTVQRPFYSEETSACSNPKEDSGQEREGRSLGSKVRWCVRYGRLGWRDLVYSLRDIVGKSGGTPGSGGNVNDVGATSWASGPCDLRTISDRWFLFYFILVLLRKKGLSREYWLV